MHRWRFGLALAGWLAVWLGLSILYFVAAVQFGLANPPDLVIPLGNGRSIEAYLSHNSNCLLPWWKCPPYTGSPISTYAIYNVQTSGNRTSASPIYIWHLIPRYPNKSERTTSFPSVPPTAVPTAAPTSAVTRNPVPVTQVIPRFPPTQGEEIAVGQG